MNVRDIEHEIETLERNLEKSGADEKFLMGVLAKGVWEIARQIALSREQAAGK